jgi:hypothetical protein
MTRPRCESNTRLLRGGLAPTSRSVASHVGVGAACAHRLPNRAKTATIACAEGCINRMVAPVAHGVQPMGPIGPVGRHRSFPTANTPAPRQQAPHRLAAPPWAACMSAHTARASGDEPALALPLLRPDSSAGGPESDVGSWTGCPSVRTCPHSRRRFSSSSPQRVLPRNHGKCRCPRPCHPPAAVTPWPRTLLLVT